MSIFPTAILKNNSTNRFHPMPFRQSPRPSDDPSSPVCRHKSIGHHATGFETIEEAQEYILKEEFMWPTGDVFEWDGKDIPGTICDYPIVQPE